ncbi:ErmE/ErmH/ErmO/ErmR family 23S rRNA (adenine(2058)-N(6))-methyltransferase [Actinomadura rugatobispora]|uniref:ErmE/ErmH/ErmO/ErmR family 23S rRNA (Adenine(2058)-N(6))-methyltransferase n=1 Tax=Actinomadura rugatobispora TaxID=1994 RepID=A0ABW1A3B3_9ACTN|nr:23S rRNA (adenine(2058)-N(6))-methyltransferase Erm(O) [Actinomadura rugatobispora]
MPSDRGRRRRVLSQNLLADRATLRRFARAATDGGGLIVEVGAGDGRITTALAARAERVIAYEIDPEMTERLRTRCAGLDNVRCVTGDFLRASPPLVPFHVAGNIPYAATSPIVEWCLRAPGLGSATLITQLEYARKRTGGYGGRWSRLTVETWPVFGWWLLERIPRERFRPVPRVDAGVLRLERRERPLLPGEALAEYRRCVAAGFEGRGGTLHASLRREYSRGRVDAAFRAAELERGTVVAYVHPDQWVRLFRVLRGLPD